MDKITPTKKFIKTPAIIIIAFCHAGLALKDLLVSLFLVSFFEFLFLSYFSESSSPSKAQKPPTGNNLNE